MPTLPEVLDSLSFITRDLALLGLFVTAAMIVLVWDWRLSLLALLAQYLLVGMILSRLVVPEIALTKVLIGTLICPMLYLAARQSGWGVMSDPDADAPSIAQRRRGGDWGDVFQAGRVFRLLALTLVVLLTVALSQTFPLAAVPADVGIGCYWLMLAGLLILMLTEEPLKAGMGLLTTITGFELVYTPMERSLVVIWLWAAVNLLLTLAVAYLAVVRGVGSAEGDL